MRYAIIESNAFDILLLAIAAEVIIDVLTTGRAMYFQVKDLTDSFIACSVLQDSKLRDSKKEFNSIG